MIVEGKVAGGKQIGPYARMLTYAPGEVVVRQGEWGGNTFYFLVDSGLDVYVTDEAGQVRKAGHRVPPMASKAVDVPLQIEAAVRHALEKEPEHRPASAEEFIGELRALPGQYVLRHGPVCQSCRSLQASADLQPK